VVRQVGLSDSVANSTVPDRSPYVTSTVPSTPRGSQKPVNPLA
jgi:hypothetical protein